MDYVLGVDGGNTKTIALLARLDGTVIGSGRAGCSDIYGAGSPEAALAEVERAAAAALQPAGLAPGQLAAAAFSMAGADWPEDFEVLHAGLGALGFDRNRLVVNDALGGLRAGSPDGYGVAVICGTGTATGARAPDGRTWHSSWWQDTHGAHQLGHWVLRAVYRAELGLLPPTALTAAVLDLFGARTVEEVLHTMTARVRGPRPNLPRLARPLLDAAAAGDEVAYNLVREQAVGLGDYALAAARQVGLGAGPLTLVLGGGVLRHPSPLMRETLVARVQAEMPGARPVMSDMEPVAGAVLLALEAAGASVDAALRERLKASLPPAALFET